MLVTTRNNRSPEGCTEATVLGPFHVADSRGYELGEAVSNGAAADPYRLIAHDGLSC